MVVVLLDTRARDDDDDDDRPARLGSVGRSVGRSARPAGRLGSPLLLLLRAAALLLLLLLLLVLRVPPPLLLLLLLLLPDARAASAVALRGTRALHSRGYTCRAK